MLKYIMMKRLTQFLASILFIITVLTVYLAFDFAVTSVGGKKYTVEKHQHVHDEHLIRKTSIVPSLLKPNLLSKQQINDQGRRSRSLKQKPHAQFHKSKTGVKINQVKKPSKELRKRPTTTNNNQRKELPDKVEISKT